MCSCVAWALRACKSNAPKSSRGMFSYAHTHTRTLMHSPHDSSSSTTWVFSMRTLSWLTASCTGHPGGREGPRNHGSSAAWDCWQGLLECGFSHHAKTAPPLPRNIAWESIAPEESCAGPWRPHAHTFCAASQGTHATALISGSSCLIFSSWAALASAASLASARLASCTQPSPAQQREAHKHQQGGRRSPPADPVGVTAVTSRQSGQLCDSGLWAASLPSLARLFDVSFFFVFVAHRLALHLLKLLLADGLTGEACRRRLAPQRLQRRDPGIDGGGGSGGSCSARKNKEGRKSQLQPHPLASQQSWCQAVAA